MSTDTGSRGDSPYEGVWLGRGSISFADTGPARVGVERNGRGVISCGDRKGRSEDWLVFVKDDGTFTGNQWGDTGSSEGVSGTLAISGADIVAVVHIGKRPVGTVIKARHQ